MVEESDCWSPDAAGWNFGRRHGIGSGTCFSILGKYYECLFDEMFDTWAYLSQFQVPVDFSPPEVFIRPDLSRTRPGKTDRYLGIPVVYPRYHGCGYRFSYPR
jgi:hypothetical protein